MLFMVIEKFKQGDARSVGERFHQSGRMLPPGVAYLASWVDTAGARCFQLMATDKPALLETWTKHWEDLVEFEIVPVLTSSDFWAKTLPEQG